MSPALNATINYTFQQTNRELSISINEIIREEGCEEGGAGNRQYENLFAAARRFYPLFVDLRERYRATGSWWSLLKPTISASMMAAASFCCAGAASHTRRDDLGYIAFEDGALDAVAEEFWPASNRSVKSVL